MPQASKSKQMNVPFGRRESRLSVSFLMKAFCECSLLWRCHDTASASVIFFFFLMTSNEFAARASFHYQLAFP